MAIAGAIGFMVLPVAPLPQVDFPTINVSASLPGASAEIMAASVATPLERQLGHIAGITEMTSSSSLGSTRITLQFDLSRNIDGAARDVQAAINAARTYLPANLPSNPRFWKSNPADAPIMILGITSDKYDVTKVYDLASTILDQKLSTIDGVGQVFVGGGATPSVRVEVDPTKLESFGLTLSSIRSLLSLQNSHSPRGQLSNGAITADIITNDQISKAADYKPLIIGYHNGAAVRLSDVADVYDSTQNLRTAGYMDGTRAVFIIIFRQPGANIIQTVDNIRSQLPFLAAVLPQGIKITTVLDRTNTIRASVETVEKTLLGSIVLVVLVVFIFLRSPRATLIPSVAVPVSLIGTFAVMYLLGFSIDNLSLMALTIATGFVVDDAIVVMENITRHLESGMPPFNAALVGAREIGFTVFSISMSLIAVFIPILMMGGIIGRLFREFAVTLSVAIVVSMVISLTTTPMMCAHLLRHHEKDEKHNIFYRASEKFFDGLLSVYRGSLRWALDNPVLILIVLALTIALNVVVIVRIPKGFFPQQDTGAVVGGVQGPQDASFAFMNYSIQQLVKVIRTNPNIAHVNAYTGGNGSSNGGFIYIALKPLGHGPGQRTESAMQIINDLRPKMARLPVASAFLQPVQDLRIGGRGCNALYQYTVQSDDIPDLAKWGPILLDNMRKLPGLQDVNTDQQNGGLRRAARLRPRHRRPPRPNPADPRFGPLQRLRPVRGLRHLHPAQPVLRCASRLRRQYWRIAQRPQGYLARHRPLRRRWHQHAMSPLATMTRASTNTTPLQVNHTGLFPSVTVSFNLGPRLCPSATPPARSRRWKQRLGMPSTVHGFFAGTAQAYPGLPRQLRSTSSSPPFSPSTSSSASSMRAWSTPSPSLHPALAPASAPCSRS